ncbi:hypothetical protein ETB97_004805 [Aspergillus alliaceus]|uniref:Nucleoside phosphorylase domain-containing protein n=1 Tax=Petromyces alliaceus TaxID=209559 RepID=A0A8H6ADY1_PETAA|nr:hypothetical protein ETB97_004805 [Aspergillus burnettii]
MVGWICVLKSEFRAAVTILDEKYDRAGLIRGEGDRNHYVLGITMDMRSTFPRIRCVLLVGIAGGAPSEKNDIRLGDVVLGTKIVPYATVKDTDHGFLRTGLIRTPPSELLETITFLEERLWSENVSHLDSMERIRTRTARGRIAFLRPA